MTARTPMRTIYPRPATADQSVSAIGPRHYPALVDDHAARARQILAEESISAQSLRTREDKPITLEPSSREIVQNLRHRSVRSGLLSPRGYNLTISHAHRFLWFRVAKVGTRSLFEHFEANGVVLDVRGAVNLRYPTALVEDYFAFAFVRHPVDRFISAWRNKVVSANYFDFDAVTHESMQDLSAFVEYAEGLDLDAADRHIAPQSRLIDLTRVDYLGRLETFADDMGAISDRLGLPSATLPRKNSTSSGAPDPVASEVRDRIADLYRRDLQIFGYPAT